MTRFHVVQEEPHPSDFARYFADALARCMSTSGVADKKKSILSSMGELRRAPGVAASGRNDRVAIWSKSDAGAYRRDPQFRNHWSYWADVESFQLREGVRRIAWIGESVARGQFFDPAYTPASALEKMLTTELCQETQVIDLARRGMQRRELLALVQDAHRQLSPDVVVIFAGNNWAYEGGEAWSDMAAQAFDRGGVRSWWKANSEILNTLFEKEIRETLKPLLEGGIPIIWVVPGYNLADWSPSVDGSSGLCADGNVDLTEWWACLTRFERLLSAGRLEEAERLSVRILELDSRSNARSLYGVAQLKLAQGDIVEARALLRESRDSPCLMRPWSPRATGPVQQTLRSLGSLGVSVVDLSTILEESCHLGIPGADHFLDYCHMTAEGLGIACAAVMVELCKRWDHRVSVDGARARAREVAPSSREQAHAHFLAAVHSAHWGQPRRVVRDQLRRSVSLDVDVLPILEQFAFAQVSEAPNDLRLEPDFLSCMSNVQLRHYFGTTKSKSFDFDLIGLICEILSDDFAFIRSISKAQLARLLPDDGPVDLSDDYFRPSWVVERGAELGPTSRMAIALHDSLEFVLAGAVRLPAEAIVDETIARVFIDGVFVDEVKVGRTWRRFQLKLRPSPTGPKLAELEFHWAAPRWNIEMTRARSRERIQRGVFPHQFPVQPSFAELANLSVACAQSRREACD